MTWRAYAGLALLLAAFGSGYWLRDVMADRETAQRDAGDAQAEVAVVTEAREDDKASQAGASEVEQQRVEQAASTENNFKIIYRDVVRYVQTNPSLAGCGADAEWVRLWNAANAGRIEAEPVDTGRAAGAVPGTDGR